MGNGIGSRAARGGRRRWRGPGALLAAAAGLLALAVPTSAGAQTVFLGPDLTPPPDNTLSCANPCTFFGLEGPYNPSGGQFPHPITAPDDGTITRLDLRDQQGATDPVPIELVQMDLVGNQLLFKSFHPLGNTSVDGINSFTGLAIPVDDGTVLGVSVEPATGGGRIDGYSTPGENGAGVVDPTPAQGEQKQPNVQAEGEPAIRLAFVPGGGGGQKTDIEVTKTRTSKRRPSVGGTATFDVTVRNKGPANATGVTLYDSYDDPDLISRGASGGLGCAVSPLGGTPPAIPTLPASWGGNTVLICNVGNLAAGARKVYEFSFEVGPLPFDVQSKVVHNYAAAAAGSPTESTYVNNYDDDEIKVRRGGCRVRDAITGTERKDRLVGKRKPEAIYGLGKGDKLKGKKGDDCLFGNEGADKLIGGPGRDLIDGGKGNDKIKARDGKRDKIDCGPGRRDKAKVDRKDRVKRNCEKVKVR